MKLHLPLVAIPMLLSACAPCSESCTQQAAIYDLCLAEWSLEWADLGATNQEDFRYGCSDGNQLWIQSLDEESAAVQEQHCSDLATALRGETNCAEAWEALVSYGAAP